MSFLTIMGITTVMMKTTMKPAFLTEEIAVDQMSIHNTAQNANALEEEGAVEELQHQVGDVKKLCSIFVPYKVLLN